MGRTSEVDGPLQADRIRERPQSAQSPGKKAQPAENETESANAEPVQGEKLHPESIQPQRPDLSTDPENESFNLKSWVQNSMSRLAEAGYVVQGSGVIFKNLSVSGTGVTLSVQETVGSILTLPFRRLFRSNIDKKTELRILSHFSGILKSGELLAVLGRPGSGCTTLLKALSGELSGLTLNKGSIITYSGTLILVLPDAKFEGTKQRCSAALQLDKLDNYLAEPADSFFDTDAHAL
jgi:ABC-type glutathione transport system ATPase component